MEHSITTTPTTTTDAPAVREFSPAELDIIRSVVARGATDVELRTFLLMAQKLGLDPLTRQIHCVKRLTKLPSGETGEVMTITVGIDGYRLLADRTGCYCPGRAPTYTTDDTGRLDSATAYVLKLAGGVWHEVGAVAFWDEYAPLRNGRPTAMWARMPRLMLAKCAEALALRRAFPAELSGVYTDDEMAQAASEAPGARTGQPVVRDAPEPAANATPAWQDELARLGKRAVALLQTGDALPAAQRQQIDAAVTQARDVFARNGSSTADERAQAIDALRQALGAPA